MGRGLRIALFASAAFLVVAGAVHALHAVRGVGDVARHGVFVAVNLAAAAIVARAPSWAIYPIGLLALQQATSHGRDLVASLRGPGPVDVTSAFVLGFFAALITLLFVERRRRTPDRTGRP